MRGLGAWASKATYQIVSVAGAPVVRERGDGAVVRVEGGAATLPTRVVEERRGRRSMGVEIGDVKWVSCERVSSAEAVRFAL